MVGRANGELRGRSIVAAVAVGLAVTVFAIVVPAEFSTMDTPAPTVLGIGSNAAVPGSYIVKLRASETGVAARAKALGDRHGGTVGYVWDRLLSFSVKMSERDATQLAAEPDVDHVVQDLRWRVAGLDIDPPSWGTDRIDQRSLPLDHVYRYDDSAGVGVHAYIVDTGIRLSHQAFGGRAVFGANFVSDNRTDDCHGHGTNVAGIVGGGTGLGVAQRVQLIAVRVFGCDGLATSTSIQAGINWVIADVAAHRDSAWPAVINLSLEPDCRDQAGHPTACNTSTERAIIDAEILAVTARIPVVVAAGNANQDACNNPFVNQAGIIGVGAVDQTDARWVESATRASNFGACVNIWAPGKAVTTARNSSDTATGTMSATSAAAAHVTGAIALLLGSPQFAHAGPFTIRDRLVNAATSGVLTGLGANSSNKLLYTGPLVSTGTSVALTHNSNGSLVLFGVNTDGLVFWRSERGAGWGQWTHSETHGWRSVAATIMSNGRIELMGLTANNEVWHRQQKAANSDAWTNWSGLHEKLLASVAVAVRADSRLELVGTDGRRVWHRRQTSVNSRGFDDWAELANPIDMATVAAHRTPNGTVDAFTVNNVGAVYHNRQTAPNASTWTGFSSLSGGIPVSEVAVALNGDSKLELVATDGTGSVYCRAQDAVNGPGWTSPWGIVKVGKAIRHVAVESNADSRLVVVGVDEDGNIWQTTRNSPGGSCDGNYSPWTQIDGKFRP